MGRDFDGGELRSWALARCAGLIAAHGVPVIMDAFDAATEADAFDALEAYARTCLQRFDYAPDDTVARVLGGGVAHRWRGRLAATEGDLARALQSNAAATRFLTRYADAVDVTGPSVAWSRRRARRASSTTRNDQEKPRRP